MYRVYLQTSGNKPLIFGGGSPDTSASEDLSGVDFVNGTRPGNTAIVDLAKRQVGNVGGYPYWSWYGFNSRVEWCACFVSWCYGQMGLSEPRFAACQSQGIPWFTSHGQWGARGYENIAPGDAIFFDWDLDGSADHVGLVIGRDANRVYTVEGNSGDACKIKSYPLDKGKQFKILKDLMRRADVSEVVNACDAGREGELIFRFVYHQAGCKKPFTRLWISSMENEAIRSGFDNLKDGREYDALYHSALCRAKADWLIGINATRLFSCLYGKTLNVGRVQTPTLKMLVDRDAAIMNFKKETYYHVRLMLSGAEAASAKIRAADEASELKAACEASAAVCTSLTREKKTVAPPKLFDLTSLQREANRIYGYTAKQTLDLAQTLYEKKLLTYPRTDSNYLTDDMGDTAKSMVTLLCGKLPFMAGVSFTPELAKVLNSKKVSDHHAIIPTIELAKADLSALPESERRGT